MRDEGVERERVREDGGREGMMGEQRTVVERGIHGPMEHCYAPGCIYI